MPGIFGLGTVPTFHPNPLHQSDHQPASPVQAAFSRSANARLLARLEKTLMLTLLLGLALPLTLGFWLRLSHNLSPRTTWLRNATLYDVPHTEAVFSLEDLLTGKFQNAIAGNYGQEFAGRELLVRLANEGYARFLNRTASTFIGRDGTLFDESYVRSARIDRPASGSRRLPFYKEARRLRRLQEFCAARGIAFALMITPNKASVYPEDLPEVWQRRNNPEPSYYEALLTQLRANGIHFVDGHQLLMQTKDTRFLPLFPAGGYHWTDRAALTTGNALLSLLADQGLAVQPITEFEASVTDDPADPVDRDLVKLLNRIADWRYPVEEIQAYPPATPSGRPKPNLVVVGGSFNWKMLRLFDESGQFRDLDFYDYYKHSKRTQAAGQLHLVAMPTQPVDFATEIFAADALVLEINEEAIAKTRHLPVFLHDATAAILAGPVPRAAFRQVGQDPYRWGDTIPMVEGGNVPRILSGFASPGPEGTYTQGALATLRLATSPASHDMRLEVTGCAFVLPPKAPRQVLEVFVNDHKVGRLVWKDAVPTTKTVFIPKELLGDELTHLQFRVPTAVSPDQLGLGADVRRLGVRLTSIRFTPVEDAQPGERDEVYRWGETISFVKGRETMDPSRVTGFAESGESGSLTDGPVAMLELVTAPAPADMVLSVEAGAFLVDQRLLAQEAEVFVNGHAVGRWTWRNSALSPHDLPVPKAYLDGGETQVEFRLPRATSPAELGLGGDHRKFGILVATVRLHEAGK